MLTKDQNAIVESNIGMCYWYVHERAKHRPDLQYARLDYDDLIEIAFYALCIAAKTYDPSKGSTFSTYAIRVFDNEFNQEARKARSKGRQMYYGSDSLDRMTGDDLELMGVVAYGETPEEIMLGIDGCESIWKVIRKVTKKRRWQEVVELKAKGLNQREIAEKLGMTQSNVSRVIRTIDKKVKDELILYGYENCVGM